MREACYDHFLAAHLIGDRLRLAEELEDLFLLRALWEPRIMYRSCIVLAMCCALFPSGSAAPKDRGQDPGSQWEDEVQQDEELREEVDGQENILSKVGDRHPFSEKFSCVN